MGEQDGGLIGAEEKVINSKNKVDENMVSHYSLLPCPVCNFETNQREWHCSRRFPDEPPCVPFPCGRSWVGSSCSHKLVVVLSIWVGMRRDKESLFSNSSSVAIDLHLSNTRGRFRVSIEI